MCSLCSLHIDTDFHIHVPGSCKDSSGHSQIVRFHRTGKSLGINILLLPLSKPSLYPEHGRAAFRRKVIYKRETLSGQEVGV